MYGELAIQGSKNAVLPLMAASLLHRGITVLDHVPEITDVACMVRILERLGAVVTREKSRMIIDATTLTSWEIPLDEVCKMRSSIMVLGPLVARMGQAVTYYPGGCSIGRRPIDYHIRLLQDLGIRVREEEGRIEATAEDYRGAILTLDFPSVGATENAILAATGAKGETVICGCAREPEIVELCAFLQAMGIETVGAGTDRIRVWGQISDRDPHVLVSGDRIAAGTYLAAAAATGGELLLQNACPDHMESFLQVLETMGCRLLRSPDTVYIKAPGRLRPAAVRTGPHPGFPTDLQSPLLTLMCLAEGESQLEETIFEARFRTAEELAKMGAAVTVSEGRARIRGTGRLFGARVQAPDLRGGAALVVAGLAAEGKTIVENICHIDRGYDTLELGMGTLGAEMIRKGQNKKK